MGGVSMVRVAALIMALVATTASAQQIATPDWASRVVASDWQLVSAGPDQMFFVRPGPKSGAPNLSRLWTRFEYRAPQPNSFEHFQSMIDLWEFDCANRTYRSLQQTQYEGANLTGATLPIPSTVGAPTYPIPHTLADTGLMMACPQ